MYCEYPTLCLNTMKVLCVVVVNKRQVKVAGSVATMPPTLCQVNNCSPSMEPAAARASIQMLERAGVNIRYFVTDRSV